MSDHNNLESPLMEEEEPQSVQAADEGPVRQEMHGGIFGAPPSAFSFAIPINRPPPSRFSFGPSHLCGPLRRPPQCPSGGEGGSIRRGRRRPPPQFGRPATAFILFFVKMLRGRCNRGRRVADVAKDASRAWRALPPQEKNKFRRIYCSRVQVSRACRQGGQGQGGQGGGNPDYQFN